jgi:hypothetical protein
VRVHVVRNTGEGCMLFGRMNDRSIDRSRSDPVPINLMKDVGLGECIVFAVPPPPSPPWHDEYIMSQRRINDNA